MRALTFLPFAPALGVTDANYADGLECIASDVKELLSGGPQDLWHVVREEPSLTVLLDSFLRYAPRPWDADAAVLPPVFFEASDALFSLFCTLYVVVPGMFLYEPTMRTCVCLCVCDSI